MKGSLENVDDGFQFRIKNSLSDATSTGMDPIKVNGTTYSLDKTMVSSEGVEVAGNQISSANSFAIRVGVEITIRVKGDQLPTGDHTIEIGLTTPQTGKIAFDVKDSIK